MLRSFLAATLLLCSSAFAQQPVSPATDCIPCGSAPQDGGTYILATGQWIPPGQGSTHAPVPNGTIYNNTCSTGFFSSTLNGTTLLDDGRVPSTTSPAPNTGTMNNYKVNSFQIQYCTRDLAGVYSIRVRFWNKLAMTASSCTTLAGAGAPTADYTITPGAGSATTGTLSCWFLTVDLTGLEFCMQGDADGVFNTDAFSNGFGYGLTLLGQTGTTNATVGGFIIAGKFTGTGTCGFGDGTYYKNPSLPGNGLDNDPTFYRDGQGGTSSGCFTFSANGFNGYAMLINADLGGCAFCPGNPDDDGDGTLNCLDGCPNDANKTSPGICGCGVPDVGDSDGDGTLDCVDGCPFDSTKTSPGQCGCGIPDTDSDGDGVADCVDGCPNDSTKTSPGICGCGVSDVDTDGDGTADCLDGCPSDSTKTAPGICGCGVSDVDTDGDGTADCLDGCPLDSTKTGPGQCGCGNPDTDTDGDGTADCNDGCPLDSNKTSPGVCGCGLSDADLDGDGSPDCNDLCPNDPFKSLPGICGCGVPDTDTDGDGVADCNDGCPFDASKTSPGICGCGISDVDSDGDGVADCNDGCPFDANKTSPGVCGCGVSDVDSDGDGTPNCNDGCPNDANKTSPGICGCGVSDVDSDGDGTADCIDGCPSDSNKVAPGQCGCGIADTDTDGDGVANCNDLCPNDASKIAPGQCGCGNPDTDTDGDGVADCHDNCVNLANPGQEDCNGNSIGDACDIASSFSLDVNGDAIPDECQQGAGLPYCFGDGSGTSCPCGNNDGTGAGCKNSTGNGALLYNLGGASVGSDDTALYVVRMPHNKNGLIFMASSPVAGGNGIPFFDGLICAGGFTHRFGLHNSGANGSFSQLNVATLAPTLITAGSVWNFQTWHRDPAGPCGTNANFSNAVRITFGL